MHKRACEKAWLLHTALAFAFAFAFAFALAFAFAFAFAFALALALLVDGGGVGEGLKIGMHSQSSCCSRHVDTHPVVRASTTRCTTQSTPTSIEIEVAFPLAFTSAELVLYTRE